MDDRVHYSPSLFILVMFIPCFCFFNHFFIYLKELKDPAWLNEFSHERLLVGFAEQVFKPSSQHGILFGDLIITTEIMYHLVCYQLRLFEGLKIVDCLTQNSWLLYFTVETNAPFSEVVVT